MAGEALKTEKDLKEAISAGPRGVFFLYGAETYLVEQYAIKIADAVTEGDFDAFNRQSFDGQTTPVETLLEAVDAMPMMEEYKCVLVRDINAGGEDSDRLVKLVERCPDTCVLVFRQVTTQPDRKKGWQAFREAVAKKGMVVCFDRRTPEDAAKMLVSGFKRRGCPIRPEDARYLVEQAGNDLQLLQNEMDKLAALADANPVTREMIDRVGTKNLEARVFDLSKAILAGQTGRACALLDTLFTLREEPVAILGVLSNAFADLYRAKATVAAGKPADSLAAAYKSYKGKEFRLRNGARDASRLSVACLRDCLAILAEADGALKLFGGDERVRLEQTVIRLIRRTREG